MLRRLLKLNSSFLRGADSIFLRSLQLLRLVAAPGMGKVSLACRIFDRTYSWWCSCCHHQSSQLLQGGAGSACLAHIAVQTALSCANGD